MIFLTLMDLTAKDASDLIAKVCEAVGNRIKRRVYDNPVSEIEKPVPALFERPKHGSTDGAHRGDGRQAVRCCW